MLSICLSCQQSVSSPGSDRGERVGLDGRYGYADLLFRTQWTMYTALSRWRHGFESRWGCSTKVHVKGL